MMNMHSVDLDYGYIYEPIYTRKEFLAATLEHYMILEDNDREEALQQRDVRLYFGEELSGQRWNPEPWFQYGSVWWEQ